MKSTFLWFLLFCGLVAFIHVPNIRTEIFDIDEATFMLMGQDILRGNLPYVSIFDNKPPLLFYLFAGFFKIFGKTLFAARLLGEISILVVSIFTFVFTKKPTNSMAAGIATAIMIVLTSAKFASHTSAELPAMAFMSIGIYILVCFQKSCVTMFFSGILFSLAILIRTNLAFTALAPLVFCAFNIVIGTRKQWILFLIMYIFGLLAPISFFVMLYKIHDSLNLLYLCGVLVPLSYALGRATITDVLLGYTHNFFYFSIVIYVLVFLIVLQFLFVLYKHGFFKKNHFFSQEILKHIRNDSFFLSLIAMFTVFSILRSGAFYGHYLLQIFPFIAFLIAYVLHYIFRHKKFCQYILVSYSFLFCFFIFIKSKDFLKIIGQINLIQSQHAGVITANLIKKDMSSTDKIWAISNHIILFYLNMSPVSKLVAHPNNISQTQILQTLAKHNYVSENEFTAILESTPKYVIINKKNIRKVVYLSNEQNEILLIMLNKKYVVWKTINDIFVYKRRDNLSVHFES